MFSRRIVPFNIWKLVFPVPPMRIGADELKRAKTEKFFTNKKPAIYCGFLFLIANTSHVNQTAFMVYLKNKYENEIQINSFLGCEPKENRPEKECSICH